MSVWRDKAGCRAGKAPGRVFVEGRQSGHGLPDLSQFLNGLPFAVIELKNPADEKADIWKAYEQLQTYKEQIPDLFLYNELLVISDGTDARFGSLSASKERYIQWRTIDGTVLDPLGEFRELETLIRGLFDPKILLDYLRYFVLFEDDGQLIKKVAGYHQFHAVLSAVNQVVKASSPGGDHKGGVVWPTQTSYPYPKDSRMNDHPVLSWLHGHDRTYLRSWKQGISLIRNQWQAESCDVTLAHGLAQVRRMATCTPRNGDTFANLYLSFDPENPSIMDFV